MGGAEVPGLGWSSIALSFGSLGLICLIAWAGLRLLAGRGIGGGPARATGAIRILARCPLEPHRSVFVIEAAGRCFLVGVGDGPMSLLAELDAGALGSGAPFTLTARSSPSFAEVLRRVVARRSPPAADAGAPQREDRP